MKKNSRRPENLNYIDLFAGCGGLSLGLHYAGYEGLFAIEKDQMAFDTLSTNMLGEDSAYPHFDRWPSWLPKTKHDLCELLNNVEYRKHFRSLRGRVMLVCGGPPCQGFSIGGARRVEDIRNDLPFEFLKFVKLVKPVCVLLENVLGIARPFSLDGKFGGKSVASLIVEDLQKMGYVANFTQVRALDFGVPQDRRRTITFGIDASLAGDFDPGQLLSEVLAAISREQLSDLSLPLNRHVTIKEALDDLSGDDLVPCPDAPKFSSARYLPAKSSYGRLMRCGIRAGTIPDSHRFSKHGERVSSLYDAIHRHGIKGRVPRDFLLSHNTKTLKKVLLDPEGYSSTITTHPDETIHYKYSRNISVREMARIQSFPDNWRIRGRYTLNGERRKLDVSRCAQIGNAIPPLMGRALGLAIREIYEALTTPDSERRLLDKISFRESGQTKRLFP